MTKKDDTRMKQARGEGDAQAADQALVECQIKLAEAEKKLEEKQNDYLRALADYRNLERRVEEDRRKIAKIAATELIEDLLLPLDHLELAVGHVQDKGLVMVLQQFHSVLEQHGVTELQVAGKTFDPSLMEAVETVEGEKDQVINVRKKGYTLNGVLLRHAQVEVGKGN